MLNELRELHVAICDDDKRYCSELEELLKKVANQLNIRIYIDVWFSGEALQEYLKKGNPIDIIFLDIELMRLSGIDVGTYIRRDMKDNKTQIIYISSKSSYAIQLFKTQPFDFLIKPIHEEDLYGIMERLAEILLTQNRLFEYQNGRVWYQIPYEDILYFRSELHKVVIVTQDKEIEFYGKLSAVIEQVPPQFVSIHKSYLINREYVETYIHTAVKMKNNTVLAISKAFQKQVRDKLGRRRDN